MCTSYFVKWRLVCLDNCYLITLTTCSSDLAGVRANLVQPENDLLRTRLFAPKGCKTFIDFYRPPVTSPCSVSVSRS